MYVHLGMGETLTEAEAEVLFAFADKDGDGSISFEEFKLIWGTDIGTSYRLNIQAQLTPSAKLCMMPGQSSSPVMHDACEHTCATNAYHTWAGVDWHVSPSD